MPKHSQNIWVLFWESAAKYAKFCKNVSVNNFEVYRSCECAHKLKWCKNRDQAWWAELVIQKRLWNQIKYAYLNSDTGSLWITMPYIVYHFCTNWNNAIHRQVHTNSISCLLKIYLCKWNFYLCKFRQMALEYVT